MCDMPVSVADLPSRAKTNPQTGCERLPPSPPPEPPPRAANSSTISRTAKSPTAPDAEIAWRDVWFGAAITSVLFTVGKSLIGLYLGQTATTSVYGAAASFVVLLLWNYDTAQIFLFGAELTKAYAIRCGSGIVPSPYAISVNPAERIHQGMAKHSPQGGPG